jgi:hypothetical protein
VSPLVLALLGACLILVGMALPWWRQRPKPRGSLTSANGVGSQRGDMLWTFALNGQSKLQPMPNPTQLPIIVTGFTGAITPGASTTPPNKVTIADLGYTPHPYMVGQILVADADDKVPNAAPASEPGLVHP